MTHESFWKILRHTNKSYTSWIASNTSLASSAQTFSPSLLWNISLLLQFNILVTLGLVMLIYYELIERASVTAGLYQVVYDKKMKKSLEKSPKKTKLTELEHHGALQFSVWLKAKTALLKTYHIWESYRKVEFRRWPSPRCKKLYTVQQHQWYRSAKVSLTADCFLATSATNNAFTSLVNSSSAANRSSFVINKVKWSQVAMGPVSSEISDLLLFVSYFVLRMRK